MVCRMKKIRRACVALASGRSLLGNALRRGSPTARGQNVWSDCAIRRPLVWLLSLALILGAMCSVPGLASAAGTGHITGVVTGANGIPLEGVEVEAHLDDDGYGNFDYVESVWTGSDGTYDLSDLAAGTYRVRFTPGSGSGYLGESYDNAPLLYAATDIVVTDGSTASGKNAELAVGGNITGRVTGAGNLPLFGITVTAWRQTEYNWYPDYATVTKVDGTYDLKGLPTDDAYILEFSDESDEYISEYYDDTTTFNDAADVPATASSTTSGKNAQLALNGHITGTVTGTGGVPLEDVTVDVYRSANSGWEEIPGGGTWTAADGTYKLDHLSTGPYRLKFSSDDAGYAFEYYNNAATVGSATDIAVTGGGTTSGIDVQLTPGGNITGTVTGSGGIPLEDVAVIAYRNDGSGWEEVDQWGWTYEDGNYVFAALPAGTYRLKFSDFSDDRSRYATEYYDNAATVTTATDVQVSAGSTTSGKSAQLAPGGNITGTVTGTGGAPVENVWVRAYLSDGDDWAASNDAATAEDGSYDLAGLPTGTYRLEFSDSSDEYATEYYDNASSLEAATSLQVTAASTTSDKNVQLSTEPIPAMVSTSAPSISGTPQVESTLTATTGTWDPSAGLTFSYRWLVDGTAVTGATSSTYVPLVGDIGKTVQVKVNATKAGYATGTATSIPTAAVVAAAVETPTISNTALPKISVTPKVGVAVTATPGTWNSAGTTFAYQWLIAGSPIAGATQPSYKPTADDARKLLQVRVTASATGHVAASATSTAATVGKGTLKMTKKPNVTGKAKKKATIRVSPGTWSPAKVKVTYQWFAGKKAIPKATAAKLKLAGKTLKTAAGKTISVLVTVTAPGYVTATAKLKVRGKG
jgi:5-hydroxyisourate hydrolase-like protein (transthyretin family)